ncbi:MAG: hypothetical protein IJU16_00725 [Clostridia bacterium]|nr:hypothetical protein [Clostridia bacterium]
MRRCAVLACLLAVGVWLSACRAEEPMEPVTSGFRCQAEVIFDGMTVCGTLTREAAGTLTLSLTAPKELAGLTAAWDGTQVVLSLGSMRLAAAAGQTPMEAPLSRLCEALDLSQGQRGCMTDEAVVLENGTDTYGYVLRYDAATGFPQTLTVSDPAIEAVFTDWERTTTE